MAEVRIAEEIRPPEPPPESRQPGAIVWIRHNLFNTPFNTVLTVVLFVVLFFVFRGLVDFLFAEGRLWGVIPRNATNYAVEAYPREELLRAWISLGIVAALAGLSLAAWRPSGLVSPLRIVAAVRALGATILVVGLLSPSSYDGRLANVLLGAALLVLSIGGGRLLGDRAREPRIPILAIVLGVVIVGLAVVWLLPIASSTKIPLTVVAAVAVVAHLLGRLLDARLPENRLKLAISAMWVLSLPVIYLHIQRAPIIPWDLFLSGWLPWVVPIVVVGFAAIEYVSRAGREQAALVNGALVLASIVVWPLGAPFVARVLLLLLTGLSLATPAFASSPTGRRAMLGIWIAGAAFMSYFFLLGEAEAGLPTRNEYFGGLNLTFMLAIAAILLSFPLGILLALGRTSTMPLFRLLSTSYIETVRGVPLITVLFFAVFVIPNFLPIDLQIDSNVVVLAGLTFFSAAYLAENIRGGLQSIPKGQYEAAKALGMTTSQLTMLITLPQALRAVIPAIVGQVISLFKDTSLVAIVGLADFFRVARDIVPNQPQSLGSILENLIFAAVVYWVFTFSFSRASLRLEQRLGVGTR